MSRPMVSNATAVLVVMARHWNRFSAIKIDGVRRRCPRQQDEPERAQGSLHSHGKVKGPQRHEAAERGKDEAADDPSGSHADASDQADESGRRVEIAAAPTEEVRQ